MSGERNKSREKNNPPELLKKRQNKEEPNKHLFDELFLKNRSCLIQTQCQTILISTRQNRPLIIKSAYQLQPSRNLRKFLQQIGVDLNKNITSISVAE